MCSVLAPRAPIPDGRMAQIMQPRLQVMIELTTMMILATIMIDNHDDIDDHDDIGTVNQSMLPPSEELHHVTGRPPNLN